LTPAATRQGGPKFGREHLRNLLVCIAIAGEERDELLRGVTPVHEESEKTAVLTTDVAGQALQLSHVIFPLVVQLGFRKARILGASGMMPYESK